MKDRQAVDNARNAARANRADKDTYTLTVDLSNAAFDGNEGRLELAEVLDKAAARVRAANFGELLGEPDGWRVNYPKIEQDVNGNTVANATVTNSEEETPEQALAAALAVFLLDTVTRATLDAIDPQAVKQAVAAMAEHGGKAGQFIKGYQSPASLRAAIDARLVEAKEITG